MSLFHRTYKRKRGLARSNQVETFATSGGPGIAGGISSERCEMVGDLLKLYCGRGCCVKILHRYGWVRYRPSLAISPSGDCSIEGGGVYGTVGRGRALKSVPIDDICCGRCQKVGYRRGIASPVTRWPEKKQPNGKGKGVRVEGTSIYIGKNELESLNRTEKFLGRLLIGAGCGSNGGHTPSHNPMAFSALFTAQCDTLCEA